MSSVCILTDSTTQFAKPVFPGRNLVSIIPFKIKIDDQEEEGLKDYKVGTLQPTVQNGLGPRILPPTVDDFRKQFTSLGQDYNEVVALLISSQLSPAVENAMEAAEAVRGRVAVQVIDSQTISVGLGILVQIAAEAANRGAPSTEIERILRGMIPHVYTVFCIPGLTYLYHSGFIGEAQAMVGEMLGLLPIYTLEDGRLTSVEKARNYRQLMDFLQEFVDEFTDLYHIALIQSSPALIHEAKVLREHAGILFPKTPFSEHPISLPLAVMFGPRTLGVFAVETPSEKER